MRLMIASPRSSEDFEDFTYGLREGVEEITLLQTGQEALDSVESFEPDLVVVDEKISDYGPFQLVVELLKKDAKIQTAVISSLSEDDFHVQSEGLGILTSFQGLPDEWDAVDLLTSYKKACG